MDNRTLEEVRKNEDRLINELEQLQQENQSLKKQLDEKDILIKQCELLVSNVMDCYCERTDCSGRIKYSKQYDSLVQKVENQQKEFIDYLENEKDRLARECSHIYENSLGKTRLVNEDIFNEVDTILSKYKEINHIPDNGKPIGGKEW